MPSLSFSRFGISTVILAVVLLLFPASGRSQVPTPPTIIQSTTVPVPAPAKPAERVVPLPEQFSEAISRRDYAKLESLLKIDPTLANTENPFGSLPLIEILQNYYDRDCKSIVQLLLDNGADVNKADGSGLTPLMAIMPLMDVRRPGTDASIVSLLVSKGADWKAFNSQGMNILHLAVEDGNIDVVKILLSQKADVNMRDAAGRTPLHLAIALASMDMVDFLLDNKADINVRDNRGEMPIHIAMQLMRLQINPSTTSPFSGALYQNAKRRDLFRGNPLLVPLLVERGADINALDQYGVTPLLFALLNRDKINYAVLMQHKATMDTLTTLFAAAANDDVPALTRLIKAFPDAKDLRAPNGATALHVAALWNAPHTLRLLLHSGFLVNARDSAAESPLHYACWYPNNREAARLLLDAGANINAEDNYCETPLHIAVHARSPDLVRLLIEHKAALNLFDSSGVTPLELTIDQANTTITTMLLDAGSNPNIHSPYRRYFLASAIESNNYALATLLINRGANVNNVARNYEESPLEQAVHVDNKPLAALLIDKGADVNYKPFNGPTILSLTHNYNDPGMVDLLKQHGAK